MAFISNIDKKDPQEVGIESGSTPNSIVQCDSVHHHDDVQNHTGLSSLVLALLLEKYLYGRSIIV